MNSPISLSWASLSPATVTPLAHRALWAHKFPMPRRALTGIGFAVLVGLMAAGAQVNLPMHPVPMTLQSLVILLAGLLLGPWLGIAATLVYLALALIGLPVLSDGASGSGPFIGATAGYIYGFPLVAGLAGWLARSAYIARPLIANSALFGLHLVLLSMGTVWLGSQIGWTRAYEVGFAPFWTGALVKSIAAWLIWRAFQARRPATKARPHLGT